jgi:putative ABC transport system permease protein
MKDKAPIKPPRLADRLFEWYCDNAAIEDLHGDMEELFYSNLEKMPLARAKRKYWQQTISLIFSYAIKKRKRQSAYPPTSYPFSHYHMMGHYIKVAVRNMLKNKIFSAINVLGLSIAITCCAMLTLFIQDELAYDRRFNDADRIYRITTQMIATNGRESHLQRCSPPIGPAMAAEFPEIELQTRVVKDLSTEAQLIKYKEKSFYEKRGYQVDSTFFQMFPYEFIEGNRRTALKQPWSMVISEELAAKLFDGQPALDQLVAVPTNNDSGLYKITGVIKSSKLKSHLDADFYLSGLEQALQPFTTWATGNFVFTYLKVKEGFSADALLLKFPGLMSRHGEEENRAMGRKKILGLQPLSDAHLYSRHFDNDIELGTSGSITYVHLTAAIGLLILILASINFINLTTARASQRAGEIGIRKAIGAQRINLFLQFIGESMGIALLSMTISFVMIYWLLPYFSVLVQKDIEITSENVLFVTGVLFAFAFITGFVAGIYPSLVLSLYEPVKILKDKQLRLGSSEVIRKGLIAFQFVISIMLISGILIIHDQLEFIQSKPLGFDAMHKIMVPLRTNEATGKYVQFKNAIASIPGVEAVTAASNSPSTPPVNDWNFYPAGKNADDAVAHYIVMVDEKYFKLMSIPSAAGRDFSFPADGGLNSPGESRKVIVNRASLQKMGIDLSTAVGTQLLFANNTAKFEIVGVIEDFHQFSLHKSISPIIFYASADSGVFRQTIIALNPEYSERTLSKIKETWVKLIPDTPFESEPLSASVQRQYENDKRVSFIITCSTVLAIVISCLGLYGLSIFIAEKRTKEIGIRKVMGASTPGIVALLSGEFLKILLIAFIIGAPVSYFLAKEWLSNFAYRMNLGIGSFLMAGLISLLIAMAAIAFESFSAARLSGKEFESGVNSFESLIN